MTKVQEYYNQCYPDYKLIWKTDKNLSIHAGFYDTGQESHNEAVVRMNEVLASKAEISPGDRVLDSGCGIGGSSIWLAKHIGCNVVGINTNSNQLSIAKELVEKNKVEDLVSFYTMDFHYTRFLDSSFDVVWMLESSCYAEDKPALLEEVKRLLRPGGRVIVADGFLSRADAGTDPDMKVWLEGFAVPNLASVPEFRGYLAELGFVNIVYDNITRNVMPSSKRMYLAAVTTYPIGKVLEFMGLRTRVQTANVAAAKHQHTTLVEGLWEYGVFIAESPGGAW